MSVVWHLAPVLTPKQLEMAKIISRIFTNAGVPDKIIAAAIVNAYAESRLDPNIIGDSGHSVGLFQLNDGPRAAGRGMTVAERQDPEVNTRKILKEYFDYWPKNDPAGRSDDVAVLSAVFCKYIERPKDVELRMRERSEMARKLFPKGVSRGDVQAEDLEPAPGWQATLESWLDTMMQSIGIVPEQASWSADAAASLQDLEGQEWEPGSIPPGTYTLFWNGRLKGRVDAQPGWSYTVVASNGQITWKPTSGNSMFGACDVTYGFDGETGEPEGSTSGTAMKEQAEAWARALWDTFGVEAQSIAVVDGKRQWTIRIQVASNTPEGVLGGIAQKLAREVAPPLVPYVKVRPGRVIFILQRAPGAPWSLQQVP